MVGKESPGRRQNSCAKIPCRDRSLAPRSVVIYEPARASCRTASGRFRRCPRGQPVKVLVDREFPGVAGSLSTIRQVVRESALAAGASEPVCAAAVQAVHEAAVNAIVHAYGGGSAESPIGISGGDGDGWLRFAVADQGAGFHPRRTSPGYGLGLAIIAQLADELQVRDGEDGGMVVAMAFRL